MFFKLLLLFILVPITELFLLLYIGQVVGIGYTLALILSTGIIGVSLARKQGFFVIQKVKEQLNYGQIPGDELLDGLFILAGSLFLLTPGLLTDTAGFIFLIPTTRYPLREYLKKKIYKAIKKGSLNLQFRKF